MSQSKRTINGIIRRALADAKQAAALASSSRRYLLTDPARDPRIASQLAAPGGRAVCLYGVDLPAELVAVSPHLVRLSTHERLGELLATQGRGLAWGLLLASAAPLDTVAEHLATLNRVTLPDGRVVLFRYYDPRVLRRFLPTCNADELARVFGPIDAFLIEQADGGQSEYTLEHGALQVRAPRWDVWLD